jgi:hypothetical protein
MALRDQELKPIVAAERVERLFPGERLICMYQPRAFRTVAQERLHNGSFWDT